MPRSKSELSAVHTLKLDIPESDLLVFWECCQFYSVQCSRAMFSHTDPLLPEVSLVEVTLQYSSPSVIFSLGELFGARNSHSKTKKV